jgi:hypothetical protein
VPISKPAVWSRLLPTNKNGVTCSNASAWSKIDGVPYWDGRLFDNTPIESMLDLLTEEKLENLPIFIVNLFCNPLQSPGEPARGAGADAGNQL